MSSTRSGDRLEVLVRGGKDILQIRPELAKRIKHLKIDWEERGGELLPRVQIDFTDPVPGGSID